MLHTDLNYDFVTGVLGRIPKFELNRLIGDNDYVRQSFNPEIGVPSDVLIDWFNKLFYRNDINLLRQVNLTDHEVFILSQRGLLTIDKINNRLPVSIHMISPDEQHEGQYPGTNEFSAENTIPLNQFAALSSAVFELSEIIGSTLRPFFPTEKDETLGLPRPIVTVKKGSTWLNFTGGSARITGTGLILATACGVFGLAAASTAGFLLGGGLISLGIIEKALSFRKSWAETEEIKRRTPSAEFVAQKERLELKRMELEIMQQQ